MALRVHWELCRKYGLECADKWYDHQPLPVAENGNMGYDYLHRQAAKAQSARYHCSAQRHIEWTLIDIAVPADQNIPTTENEKVGRYQELALERIHGPIVIGTLGTTGISKKAKLWYGRLSLPDIFRSVQLSAILGTAHIL